jgi:hypothetical protein
MQAGKVDVWNRIKSRAGEMDKADKFAEKAARDRAAKKKEENENAVIMLIGMIAIVGVLVGGFFVIQEVVASTKYNTVHHKRI